jgi:DNA processing protein
MSRRGRNNDGAAFEQLLAAVALTRRSGVGAATFKALVARFGSPARALAAHDPTATSRGGQGRAPKAALDETWVAALARLPKDVRYTYLGSEDYPAQLAFAPEPPPYLFRKGILWPLPALAVAVVGPRRASREGQAFARELASRLAARGVAVVSGGAPGIDASAHQGALDVGGPTVMVAATGIDRVYPRTTAYLREVVERRGCVMTELLPGAPPRRGFFPTRNRILVGLCQATVVVEGELRSGTWSSAAHAFKLGRPVFAWTSDLGLGQLSEHLVARGATLLRSPDASPVLEAASARTPGT